MDLLLSGCWVEGRETGYERPAELFNVFMTYSFDLHKEVTAGNIVINNQSRTMSFNKTGAGTAAAGGTRIGQRSNTGEVFGADVGHMEASHAQMH